MFLVFRAFRNTSSSFFSGTSAALHHLNFLVANLATTLHAPVVPAARVLRRSGAPTLLTGMTMERFELIVVVME